MFIYDIEPITIGFLLKIVIRKGAANEYGYGAAEPLIWILYFPGKDTEPENS